MSRNCRNRLRIPETQNDNRFLKLIHHLELAGRFEIGKMRVSYNRSFSGCVLRLSSATLHNINSSNYGSGTITIGRDGTLHALGRSNLVSDAGALINNMGSVLIECFVTFKHNGTLMGKAAGTSLCFDPGFKDPPVINYP